MPVRRLFVALFALAAAVFSTALGGPQLAGVGGAWAGNPMPRYPGLSGQWRYLDSEGGHNSPCLGVMTASPDCAFDTIMACGAWQPYDRDVREGAPGYPYGPDWIDDYHPLCQPTLWTPLDKEGYVMPWPPLAEDHLDLGPSEPGVLIYRTYGFLHPKRGANQRPDDPNPFLPQEGDLILTAVRFHCLGEAVLAAAWRQALADDPEPRVLEARLRALGCGGAGKYPSSAALRFEEGRWWVPSTFRVFHNDRDSQLEDFYGEILK